MRVVLRQLVLVIFFQNMFLSNTVLALEQEVFLEMQIGWATAWEDKTSSYTYKESDAFFSGIGGALGYKMNFPISFLQFGLSFSHGLKGEDFIRTNASDEESFSFNLQKTTAGLHMILPISEMFKLYAEYLPLVDGKIGAVNGGSLSPFESGDKLSGSASGLGIRFLWEGVSVTGIYRRSEFNKIHLVSGEQSLPSSQYSLLLIDEFLVQMGFRF